MVFYLTMVEHFSEKFSGRSKNFSSSQNFKKFSHKHFFSLRYAHYTRENSLTYPKSWNFIYKTTQNVSFFAGNLLSFLFVFTKATMSSSFDTGRVVLLLLTWLHVIDWIHSILLSKVKMAIVLSPFVLSIR